MPALRHFVADHPRDWDFYIHALTYAHSFQPHFSRSITPFQLVLLQPPADCGDPRTIIGHAATRNSPPLEALVKIDAPHGTHPPRRFAGPLQAQFRQPPSPYYLHQEARLLRLPHRRLEVLGRTTPQARHRRHRYLPRHRSVCPHARDSARRWLQRGRVTLPHLFGPSVDPQRLRKHAAHNDRR